MEIIKVIRKE